MTGAVTGAATACRVGFELPDGQVLATSRIRAGAGRMDDVRDMVTTFRTLVKNELARGGCRGIYVGIHPDTDECDHAL